MNVLARLALLFVVVPLLELALLIQIGQWVGFLPTMVLVIFTGLAGAWLARLEGLRTLWKLRADLTRGQLPGQAIMDGASILVGGALLLTPGILTDLLGFSLLLPVTRRAIQRRVRRRLERSLREGTIQMTVLGGQAWASGRPGWETPPPDDDSWDVTRDELE